MDSRWEKSQEFKEFSHRSRCQAADGCSLFATSDTMSKTKTKSGLHKHLCLSVCVCAHVLLHV